MRLHTTGKQLLNRWSIYTEATHTYIRKQKQIEYSNINAIENKSVTHVRLSQLVIFPFLIYSNWMHVAQMPNERIESGREIKPKKMAGARCAPLLAQRIALFIQINDSFTSWNTSAKIHRVHNNIIVSHLQRRRAWKIVTWHLQIVTSPSDWCNSHTLCLNTAAWFTDESN